MPPIAGRGELGTLPTSIAREAGGLTEAEAERFGELRSRLNADGEANLQSSAGAASDECCPAFPTQRIREDVDAILDHNSGPREPKGMASAFHLLAGMSDDAFPDGRCDPPPSTASTFQPTAKDFNMTARTRADEIQQVLNAFTGACVCGHDFYDHHDATLFTVDEMLARPYLRRPWVALECEAHGSNEEGGLDAAGHAHCQYYVDRSDAVREAVGRRWTTPDPDEVEY